MVTYRTAAAFRRSVEDRLRRISVESGTSLSRLRKLVAFDRLLARMVATSPDLWVLKGGYALEIRLGVRSRATKDIDVSSRVPLDEASNILSAAAAADLTDYFEFEIGQPGQVATGSPEGGLRFPVRCLLDGRLFESFHIDIASGDPLIGDVDRLTGPALLEFAGIAPATVPTYRLSQQLAEKVHAFTRAYGGRENTRVKDLVDILLIGQLCEFQIEDLRIAMISTFSARDTHQMPDQLPAAPRSWDRPFSRLATELDAPWTDLEAAVEAAKELVDPILSEQFGVIWSPIEWRWQPTR